jgi:hypothetical protein
MIVLMREMFVPRTARFALVVALASVLCLGGPPWLADCIIAPRQQHKVSSVFVNIYTKRAAATGILDG